MTAPIAKSDLTFVLPKLSYVDARLEEPNLAVPFTAPEKQSPFAWLTDRFAAFAAWNRQREAAAELYGMTDRELSDMGLNRGDIPRVVTTGLVKDAYEARCLLG